MESARAYRFRIHPDAKRREEIDRRLILAQRLYNKILEKSRGEYGKNRNSKINRSTLNGFMREAINENKYFLLLYSQTRQDVFIRLQKAFQNFFRRINAKKNGKRTRAGFPRFKSKDTYASLAYPQDNGSFQIERIKGFSRLRVARIGTMKIDMHRTMEGKVKTMAIKREAGRYYAIFTAMKESAASSVENTRPVGIDVGLNSFIAMSDGKRAEKPKFMQERRKTLARWQRIISRRKKGSRRRETAKLKLQREWERVNNRSNDYLHKLSDMLVNSGYTSFAVENLHIQNMMKNHRLAGSIQNASWSRFVQMLSYKAESAGMKVIKVDPRNTSKTCSGCGNIQNTPLSMREYDCGRCGLRLDRDMNASINILHRATTAGHAGSHARGDTTSTAQRGPQVESPNREHTPEIISGGSPRL